MFCSVCLQLFFYEKKFLTQTGKKKKSLLCLFKQKHTLFFLFEFFSFSISLVRKRTKEKRKEENTNFENKTKIALSKQLVRFLLEHCFRKLYLLRRALSNVRFIETYPNTW
jgi:hypothetical protein